MKQRIIPAIMSGGAGTRLWPVSTDAKPKQFHALGPAGSPFSETVNRVCGDTGALSFAPPVVLCNLTHLDLVRSSLADIGAVAAAIALEPVARNTAAVAATAAAVASEIDPDALVLLLPADHVIADTAAFLAAIERAMPFAHERIVAFGIRPARAETGYGYIKSGNELGGGAFAIDSFREKPNVETAQRYLAEGGYCWNAGIFLFHPRTLLAEFAASADIRDGALAALSAARRDGAEIHLDPATFAKIPSAPFDIAVMEKTTRGAVVPCDIGWADLGSWDEVWRLSPHDNEGNASCGPVAAIDARGNLLRADGVKVCVAGVSGLIIVATPEAVLVLPRERAQDVKMLREMAAKLS